MCPPVEACAGGLYAEGPRDPVELWSTAANSSALSAGRVSDTIPYSVAACARSAATFGVSRQEGRASGHHTQRRTKLVSRLAAWLTEEWKPQQRHRPVPPSVRWPGDRLLRAIRVAPHVRRGKAGGAPRAAQWPTSRRHPVAESAAGPARGALTRGRALPPARGEWVKGKRRSCLFLL